ncbi:hypothetical protein CBR_g49979 [Chara braunii]|uniref:Uncharacterized protein n=1 Tax=Chara braunii TaxID=69332 RepID=A0A388K571_CHABU|nr:hypothetical protein CBR_g49979 [Chara braunii]|eukprot:GBG65185.1 hypothetical protein CBR_g49979 [Chara braunii]
METQDIVKGIAVVSNEGISAGANTTDCAVVLAAICEQTADMMMDGEASGNDAGCVVADENVVRTSAGTLFPYDINWVPGRLQPGIVGGASCFAFKVNGEWVPYPAPKATSWRGVTLSIIFDRVLRLNDEVSADDKSRHVLKLWHVLDAKGELRLNDFEYDSVDCGESWVIGGLDTAASSVCPQTDARRDPRWGWVPHDAPLLCGRVKVPMRDAMGNVWTTCYINGSFSSRHLKREVTEEEKMAMACPTPAARCFSPPLRNPVELEVAEGKPATVDGKVTMAAKLQTGHWLPLGWMHAGMVEQWQFLVVVARVSIFNADVKDHVLVVEHAKRCWEKIREEDRQMACMGYDSMPDQGMWSMVEGSPGGQGQGDGENRDDAEHRDDAEEEDEEEYEGCDVEVSGSDVSSDEEDDDNDVYYDLKTACGQVTKGWAHAILKLARVFPDPHNVLRVVFKGATPDGAMQYAAVTSIMQSCNKGKKWSRVGKGWFVLDYPERCALTNVKFGVCPTCNVLKTDLDVVADFMDNRRSQTLETQLAAAVFTADDDDVRRAAEGRMAKVDMHRHVEQNGLWGFYRGPSGDDPQLDYHLALQPDRRHTIEHGIFLHMIDAFRAAAFEKLPNTPQTEILNELDARLQCVMETIDIRGSDDRHSGPQVEEEEEHDRSAPEKSDGAEDKEPGNEGDDNDSSRRQSQDTDEDDDSDGKSASERTGEDQSAASKRGGSPFPSRTLRREGERQTRNGSDTEERVGDRQIVQHISAAEKVRASGGAVQGPKDEGATFAKKIKGKLLRSVAEAFAFSAANEATLYPTEDPFFTAVQVTAKLAGETAEEGLRSHIAECGIRAVIGECNRMMTTIRGEITWQLKHWFWAEKGIPLVGSQQTDHHLPARNKMRTEMKENKTWRRSGDDPWGAPAFKTALLKVFQMRKEGRNLGVTLQQLVFAEMVIQCEIEQTTKTTRAAEQIEKLVSIKQAIVSSLRSRDTVMSFFVFKLDRSVSVAEKAATLFRSGTPSVQRPGPPSTTITDDDYDIEFILPQSTASGDGDRRTDSLCAAP